MKQRQRPPQRALQQILPAPNPRAVLNAKLVVQLVLAEPQHGHQIRPRAQRHLDEAVAPREDEPHGAGARVEGLARAADDDGDCAAHALAVHPPLAEEILAALAAHGGEAEGEDVLAVEGDAEVGVEREEGVCDSREQLREAEGLCGECGEGAVGDDAVRVVAEDVLACWAELGGAVQARGEVAREEGPELAAAEARGAHAEFAAVAGFGEHDVDHVGHDEGPEERDRAGEEEGADEERDGEGVREDHGGLEASLEGDVEGREADAGGVPGFAGFAAGGEGAVLFGGGGGGV
ncbi:hypothetical protein V496_04399, partial [Pseudogymnoascus sp. VKM F-4515 (FW-2607)]